MGIETIRDDSDQKTERFRHIKKCKSLDFRVTLLYK